MYFTNCFLLSHSITEANTSLQCLLLFMILQKSMNKVTQADMTVHNYCFRNITLQIRNCAKKKIVIFFFLLFLNSDPLQFYYSPTFHHRRDIFDYHFFQMQRMCLGNSRAKILQEIRANRAENDPQFCIFAVCILRLTPFLLVLFISKIACDCSITAAYSIYLTQFGVICLLCLIFTIEVHVPPLEK